MQTARDLADQVVEARRPMWERSDPSVAIVATTQLNPDDVNAVNRIVSAAGFSGADRAEMIRKVKSLIVGQVEAQNDNQPSDSQ